jgi:RNA polymerase sigma-70 factor, ECF subfamily
VRPPASSLLNDAPKEGTLQALAISTNTAPDEAPALEQVFKEHHQRIFRAAYRITGNVPDAEDVLQTVFLRLARKGGEAPPVGNLASYLYRSAVNAALDVLRDRRETPGTALEALVGTSPAPDRLHEASELRAWLRRALGRLSPQAAEAFALRYLEGHENRDIARMLGMSRMAVAVTLHRTRRRLQGELRNRTGGRK